MTQIPATDWHLKAKCKGMDTEMFFEPEPEDYPEPNAWVQATRHKAREARKFCQGCPVIDSCLAANMNTFYGVFGGLSYKQRAAMAQKDGVYIRPVDGRKDQKKMDEERVSAVLKYRNEGYSYGEIEAFTGINRGTISRILNNPLYNPDKADQKARYAVREQKNWHTPKYKGVRELLEAGKLSNRAIGEITGFSSKTVRRIRNAMTEYGAMTSC